MKNNVTISINILYAKKEKIHLVYVSKHNSNPQKKVIILIIPIERDCIKKTISIIKGNNIKKW